MEMLVKSSIWNGRRVLVTGHTGFKGGWLSLWLNQMGAEVAGFALAPPTQPNFFTQIDLAGLVRNVEGDIRDLGALERLITDFRPELIFHLAAQPLVRHSYGNPIETYETNVMGTAHVLDACRRSDSVRAIVCVTSDKCYENREWPWPYREIDPLGGHDPYSSSKGAAEIVVAAYRKSYFQHGPLVASVRAGNVIGGGDWAEDRLVPDLIKAMLAGKRPVIRSPRSVRPWQHVLDALSGYLLVGRKLLEADSGAATAWNFGPSDDDARSVDWIVGELLAAWGRESDEWDGPAGEQPHEAVLLRLDCSKARSELGWKPSLSLGQALKMVVDWHMAVSRGEDARATSLQQLASYAGTRAGQVEWA